MVPNLQKFLGNCDGEIMTLSNPLGITQSAMFLAMSQAGKPEKAERAI